MKRHILFVCLVAALLSVLNGCKSTSIEDPHVPTIYLEAKGSIPDDELPYVTMPISEAKIRVHERPIYGPNDIIRIEMVKVESGLAVRYLLTPSASRDLIRKTVDNLGYNLVFYNNTEVIGARQIDGIINDGILYTFLEVTDEELPELVGEMNRTLVAYRRAGR